MLLLIASACLGEISLLFRCHEDGGSLALAVILATTLVVNVNKRLPLFILDLQ